MTHRGAEGQRQVVRSTVGGDRLAWQAYVANCLGGLPSSPFTAHGSKLPAHVQTAHVCKMLFRASVQVWRHIRSHIMWRTITVAVMGRSPNAGTHKFVGVSPQLVIAERSDWTNNDEVRDCGVRQNVREQTVNAVPDIPQ